MNEKHDEQKQIIFKSLREALLILLKQKQFDDISISELTKKAGIARSTYYRYFTGKIELIRFLIQSEMKQFDEKYQPQTIKERFQKKYIHEVWQFLLQDKEAIQAISNVGLSHIYLEEFNKHLRELFPYRMTAQEEIDLYGLAGAQYNIIFNLFLPKTK